MSWLDFFLSFFLLIFIFFFCWKMKKNKKFWKERVAIDYLAIINLKRTRNQTVSFSFFCVSTQLRYRSKKRAIIEYILICLIFDRKKNKEKLYFWSIQNYSLEKLFWLLIYLFFLLGLNKQPSRSSTILFSGLFFFC